MLCLFLFLLSSQSQICFSSNLNKEKVVCYLAFHNEGRIIDYFFSNTLKILSVLLKLNFQGLPRSPSFFTLWHEVFLRLPSPFNWFMPYPKYIYESCICLCLGFSLMIARLWAFLHLATVGICWCVQSQSEHSASCGIENARQQNCGIWKIPTDALMMDFILWVTHFDHFVTWYSRRYLLTGASTTSSLDILVGIC